MGVHKHHLNTRVEKLPTTLVQNTRYEPNFSGRDFWLQEYRRLVKGHRTEVWEPWGGQLMPFLSDLDKSLSFFICKMPQ